MRDNYDYPEFLLPVKKYDAKVYIVDQKPSFFEVSTQTLPAGIVSSDVGTGASWAMRVYLNASNEIWYQVLDIENNLILTDWTLTPDVATGARGVVVSTYGFDYFTATMIYHRPLDPNTFLLEACDPEEPYGRSVSDVMDNIVAVAVCDNNTTYAQSYSEGAGYKFIIGGYGAFAHATIKASIWSPVDQIKLFMSNDTVYYQLANKPARYITYDQVYDYQGVALPIITMDSLDDMQSFVLTGVTSQNGRTILTGRMNRKNGPAMSVYMIGETEFTSGVDFYICESTGPNDGGRMMGYYIGGEARLIFISLEKVWSANEPMYYTGNPYPEQSNYLGSVQVSFAPNTPDQISFQMDADKFSTIQADMSIYLDLTCNDNTVSLQFVVESVTRVFSPSGQMLQVTGTSPNMNRLNQWESDAYYDYWSQTKSYGDTFDLSKMIRADGVWTKVGTVPNQSLRINDLNVNGVLYMAERATDNGSIRCRVQHVTNDYNALMGLVVGYKRETMLEAKDRMQREVTENDCEKSGWLVVHNYEEQTVEVYYYSSTATEVLTLLTSTAFVIAFDTWFYLMANYVNGHIDVYTSLDDQVYTNLLSCSTFKNYEEGRAGLFLKNETITGLCHAFGMGSSVIPMKDTNFLASPAGDGLVYGVSLFPASEQVIVDSEIIDYGAKSDNITVPTLQYQYGIEVASQTLLTTSVLLSETKNPAALRQRPAVSGTVYVRSVKLYIEKVGNPVDGVLVEIVDPGAAYGILGMSKASVAIQAKDIKNGWNEFVFYGSVEMLDTDTIQILKVRSKVGRPNATNYYVFKSGTYANGYVSFNDWTDTWTAAGAGLAFKLITYADADLDVPLVCVEHNTFLSATTAYINQAIVVTSGSGIGTCAKIVGYTHRTDTCIIYTDVPMSNMMDDTTILSIVPSLYNLTRAIPVSHSSSKIDVYRPGPFALLDKFAFFSGDIDLSLEDMVRKISRHAGVIAFNPNKLWENYGYANPLTNTFAINQRVGVFNFTVENDVLGAYHVDLLFRMLTETPDVEIVIRLMHDTIEYWSGATLVSSITLDRDILYRNTIRVSAFDRYISIWEGDYPLHSFVLTTEDAARTGTYFTVRGDYPSNVIVDFPDACLRIDNFVLDMGKNALSLIQQLIGNKRFYVQESGVSLKLLRRRKEINTAVTPYGGAYAGSETNIEPPFTRVLVEGGEVVERRDPAQVRDHGNIFSRVNIFEINNLYEAEEYAKLLMDEAKTRINLASFTGSMWPSIEVNDIVYVSFPGGVKKIIVDQVNYDINISNAVAIMDMNVTGRSV